MRYYERFNDYLNDEDRLKCNLGGLIDMVLGSDDAGEPLKKFKTTQFSAGGLTSAQKNKKSPITVSSDANRKGLVTSLSDKFQKGATGIRGLLNDLKPGFSKLRESRLNNLRDVRQRTVGTLSDNLAKRKVSGSSFGNDALVRAEREFGREEDRIIAESELAEIGATKDLIKDEAAFSAQSVQTFITELNLQADIALGLATESTSVLAANARQESLAITAQNDQRSEFIGTVIGSAATYAGTR